MQNYSIKHGSFYLQHKELNQRFSAKQLSQAANISIKTAYKWINGTQTPEPARVELMVYKVFGVIPNAPEYRVLAGQIHHHTLKRPLPLTVWPAIESLYQLNSINEREKSQSSEILANLKQENAQLKARLHELIQAFVAPRDNDQDLIKPFVAPRDKINGGVIPTPRQSLQ